MLRLSRFFVLYLSLFFIFPLQAGAAVSDRFSIELYAAGLPDARSLALGDDGTVYVGTRIEGKVYAVVDSDRDGQADRKYTLAEGLSLPNGVAFYNGDLYVAEISKILRFKGIAGKLKNPPEPEIIYDRLPTNAHHGWHYLKVGMDKKLYLSIGVPCNICKPRQLLYGKIIRIYPDGSDLEIVAKGIRNSVGFDWHPQTGELWFTDNGRDRLGDDLPADELNVLSEKGQHFGFPWCHGEALVDPKMGTPRKPCERFEPPAWEFQAHSAPLGIHFYTGKMFPEKYQGQLFVALHGSWDRSEPAGYKIVTIQFKNDQPEREVLFYEMEGGYQSRPVDFLQLPDGSLLFSDDKRGAIYRISWR
ncbi:MAG: sorbosone dehydrogenase family protein [Gammaproteobacteria bacterium]|nr:MAG: sorbosone dehydrogenase family protein [Gammaproteobacteria bacterium]